MTSTSVTNQAVAAFQHHHLIHFLFALVMIIATAIVSADQNTKIHSSLSSSMNQTHGKPMRSHVIITMADRAHRRLEAIIPEARTLLNHTEKARFIRAHLMAHAADTQASVIELLEVLKLDDHFHGEIVSLWATNQIALENATEVVINKMAQHPRVLYVTRDNFRKHADLHREEDDEHLENSGHRSLLAEASNMPWSHSTLGVDKVWATGNTGQNQIAGFIDSGFMPNHNEFKGLRVLAWKDVVNHRSDFYDDMYHGSHTMGTAIGRNIGIAKSSSAVVCKGFTSKGIMDSDIIQCAQFMLCPNGNCDHSPSVVNNAWSFSDDSHSGFEEYTKMWEEAGILGVSSTGNNFRAQMCVDLKAQQPSTFSSMTAVGATTSRDRLAAYSRRGEHSGKPDLVAPGSRILSVSTKSSSSYIERDGTSMAVPHVVAAALLMYAEAEKYKVNLNSESVLRILKETASRNLGKPEFGLCGESSSYPNAAYGAGRLNIYNAVQKVKSMA